MNATRRILTPLILATSPLLVQAQTANTPGGQASTGTPLDQTTTAPQKNVPKSTKTSPTTTNPSGSTSSRSAVSSTSNEIGANASGSGVATDSGNSTRTGPPSSRNTSAPGDVPIYPAPAPSGQPTK